MNNNEEAETHNFDCYLLITNVSVKKHFRRVSMIIKCIKEKGALKKRKKYAIGSMRNPRSTVFGMNLSRIEINHRGLKSIMNLNYHTNI